jgi:hypothetical protein
MADRPAYEIGHVDADGNLQRAPVLQAVIEVLEGIPGSSTRSNKRADEIRKLAFLICLAAGFADMNSQANSQQHPGGTDGDLRELQRAHDLLFDLAKHLFQMHRDSRLALERHDTKGFREFHREVGRWSNRATEAWSEINEGEHRAPSGSPPTKVVRAAVRSVALQAFEYLAGQPAARKGPDYGPLVEFFAALFVAFGEPPKGAANQARLALKERKAALAKAPL